MIKRLTNLSNSQSFFLFGPRGSGKSTLLRDHFSKQKTLWFDLLDQKLEFELSQSPDLLLERWAAVKSPWIVIDEVQKIPRLLDVVHRGIESHRIKFALTGSSSRKLKRGGANLLAGRAASFFLAPFTSYELDKRFNLDEALALGLLPRFWSDQESLSQQDRVRALYSYIQTYLKEEVAAEQLVRNLDPFRRFLVAAAQSNGKILNYSQIEKDSGITHSQAERHFEIICDTYLGHYLVPYETSIRKRQSKKSKFYFFDTGVVRALKNLAGEPLHPSTFEYGDLFETFLINEFFKLRDALEKRWEYSYLRTKDNVEIDLIIERPRGKPILVEIKSTPKISADSLAPFFKIAEEFKGSDKFVLSRDPDPKEIKNTLCLPWKDGLAQIFDL
ncbi:MAG: ATP-binding protein [Bdellovibrionales bacterium]